MEQERIPFDIKFRPDIEGGKYLVVTRNGKPVKKRIKMDNKLMTLDGLLERLQEIRENIGHDCNITVQVDRGNKYSNGNLSMVASDYRNGRHSALIQIDYDTLKWFDK